MDIYIFIKFFRLYIISKTLQKLRQTTKNFDRHAKSLTRRNKNSDNPVLYFYVILTMFLHQKIRARFKNGIFYNFWRILKHIKSFFIIFTHGVYDGILPLIKLRFNSLFEHTFS